MHALMVLFQGLTIERMPSGPVCSEADILVYRPQDMSDTAIKERAQAFQALGDMANALAPVGCASSLHSFLPRIAEQVSPQATSSILSCCYWQMHVCCLVHAHTFQDFHSRRLVSAWVAAAAWHRARQA